MTVKHERKRIRLGMDTRTFEGQTCKLSGAAPAIWRGTDVQIEVALLEGGTLINDLSNIDTLYLNVVASNRSGAPLITKSVVAASLNDALTAEQWAANDEANYHAQFELTKEDTQLDFSSATDQKRTFSLVVYAVTNDATPRYITYGIAQLIVHEDGAQNDLDVAGPQDRNFRISSDGSSLQILNPDTGKWHSIWVQTVDGVSSLAMDQTGMD